MAAIKQRKSSYSVIYWYTDDMGNRKQKWDTVRTRADAKRRKSQIEYYQSVNGPRLVPADTERRRPDAAMACPSAAATITLAEFLRDFVRLYGTTVWSETTYASKVRTIANYIDPIIGHWRLCDITTQALDEYYGRLLSVPERPRHNQRPSGRCVQPAGVKKIHDIIRCALNQAIRWNYLDQSSRNPATLARLPRAKRSRRAVWDVDTFRAAIDACDDDLLLICMHLAFSCSLRIGEIGGLTWDDVVIDDESIASGDARVMVNKELARVSMEAMDNLHDRDVITVFPSTKARATTRLVLKSPKTESSNRTVWLPRTVARMLAEHRDRQAELRSFLGDAYADHNLVVALDNGNPVESRVIRMRFQQLCVDNGLPVVVFHSLRHLSTGYKLKMTGGDVKSVQGDTGHAEAEMVTDVYSEIVDEDRRRNAQKMDDDFYRAADGGATDGDALASIVRTLSADDRRRLMRMLSEGAQQPTQRR